MAWITRRSVPLRTLYVAAAAALAASLAVSVGAPASAKDTPGDDLEPAAIERAFVLEDGRFTGFGVRGAVRTNAYDITNKGQVIGQYYDATSEALSSAELQEQQPRAGRG